MLQIKNETLENVNVGMYIDDNNHYFIIKFIDSKAVRQEKRETIESANQVFEKLLRGNHGS